MENQKMKKTASDNEVDPNDPFGIGLVPYHPDLITFSYTGKENLLLDFEETEEIPIPKNKYVTDCCFYNKSNSNDSDDESFFEFLTDDEVEFYECFNCKRAKYEEKKRRRGEEVKRRRRI
ncbi:hypothetical protein Glove_117g466 [Diversispora epigaea]|uniref:Uncharacterized protein n=1 Tax=Diversispora epigaea TaxID=1348612 RepID=A0A397J939_9GLOM|nr:hypothetical protein Glove_117g465 [Diversispora epigaea]RHZ81704.1 hypothetical protein Glove_117g466 [Diversispora epigaea]